MKLRLVLFAFATACTYNPNVVEITLAPDVVSSLSGALAVHAVALHDKDPQSNKPIAITIDYADRFGTAHAIAEVDGKTDQRGEFDAVIMGLLWDGTGTVHATSKTSSTTAEGDATFAVLDRTPPRVVINAPATAHAGNTVDVTVNATDEIGVSQIIFQVNGNNNNFGGNGRDTVTSGAMTVNAGFNFDINAQAPIGTVFTLDALAADLSGNEGVAAPVTVTVN
jgi:hypothetical protein